jgi:high-affinity iron transporter
VCEAVLGSYLIFAREGIEGTMICAILLTFLAAAGRRDLFRSVLAGAGAAVAVAAVAGVALWILGRDAFVGSTAQTWFETVVFGVAVAILTYMTFWMRRHARTLSREIRGRAAAAVAGGSALALSAVAFATVGREAVETVLFLVAIAYQSSPLQLGIGAALGLATALAVGFAMYRIGVRVNLGRFFTVLGSLLLVVAAGLLADAVQNLQTLRVLPGASLTLWNASSALPDSSGVGDVLHGLVGYSAAPTLLQVLLWAAFLAVGLWLFLRPAPVRRALPAASA